MYLSTAFFCYILTLILTACLIIFVACQILVLDELKLARQLDHCRDLNLLVILECVTHFLLTTVLLIAGHFGIVLLNLPLIIYHVKRYLNQSDLYGRGLYDPVIIMKGNKLERAQKESWIKLGIYMILLFCTVR